MKDTITELFYFFDIAEGTTLLGFLYNLEKFFILMIAIIAVFKVLTELLKIFVDWRYYK